MTDPFKQLCNEILGSDGDECPHDQTERDTADAEGYCALCLLARIHALEAARDSLFGVKAAEMAKRADRIAELERILRAVANLEMSPGAAVLLARVASEPKRAAAPARISCSMCDTPSECAAEDICRRYDAMLKGRQL